MTEVCYVARRLQMVEYVAAISCRAFLNYGRENGENPLLPRNCKRPSFSLSVLHEGEVVPANPLVRRYLPGKVICTKPLSPSWGGWEGAENYQAVSQDTSHACHAMLSRVKLVFVKIVRTNADFVQTKVCVDLFYPASCPLLHSNWFIGRFFTRFLLSALIIFSMHSDQLIC